MFSYSIVRTEMATPTILHLTLRAVEHQVPLTFSAGQYVGIAFTRRGQPSAVRCFSAMSSPTNRWEVELGIRVGGKFTKRLAALKEGETVHLYGPYGSFTLDQTEAQHIVLCAGGIGITPLLSMARYAADAQLTTPMTLMLSARTQAEVPFVPLLHSLTKRLPTLKIVCAIGDGPTDALQGFSVYNGRISKDIIAESVQANPTKTLVYVCGPPPFMSAMTSTFTSWGVAPRNVLTEAFGQSSRRQVSRARNIPLNIYVLGAFGTCVASFGVLAIELMRTIPGSLLPTVLTSKDTKKAAIASGRQDQLDTLVNALALQVSQAVDSPQLTAINQQIAEVNAKNAAIKNPTVAVATPTKTTTTVTKTTTSSGGTTTPTTTTPTPTPTTPTPTPPKTPVCTTSASGVKTCI